MLTRSTSGVDGHNPIQVWEWGQRYLIHIYIYTYVYAYAYANLGPNIHWQKKRKTLLCSTILSDGNAPRSRIQNAFMESRFVLKKRARSLVHFGGPFQSWPPASFYVACAFRTQVFIKYELLGWTCCRSSCKLTKISQLLLKE